MEQHRADLAGKRFGSLACDVSRGLNHQLGSILDEVADRLHHLELIGEQLRRGHLLDRCDKVRRCRDQHGIGVGQGFVAAEHDEVLAADRNQGCVPRPVGADDANRLAGAVNSRRAAGTVNARREWLVLEGQIDDAAPSGTASGPTDKTEPARRDLKDQRVFGHARRCVPSCVHRSFGTPVRDALAGPSLTYWYGRRRMKDRPRRSRTPFAFGARLDLKGDVNDAVVDGSTFASNRRGLEDPEHPPVVHERIRAEAMDALGGRVGREMLEEECRQPATLVRVGDRERDLGLVAARKSIVATDGDHLVADECDECHAFVIVDRGEVGDLGVGQRRPMTEEAGVDALLGLVREERAMRSPIAGRDGTYPHAASIGEHRVDR